MGESAAYCISEVCIRLLTWQRIYMYQLIDSFSIVLRFNADVDVFCQLVTYQNRHAGRLHVQSGNLAVTLSGRCTAVPSNIIILRVGLPVAVKTLADCYLCFVIFHLHLNSYSTISMSVGSKHCELGSSHSENCYE